MKFNRVLFLFAALTACVAVAQTPQADTLATPSTDSAATQTAALPRKAVLPTHYIGLRGGASLTDMHYSRDLVGRYRHHRQLQGMIGLFGHFQLGNSGFALRPEVTLTGRADSLQWHDAKYSLHARYLDLRLPVTFNFRIPNRTYSPYLMLAPELNLPYNGSIRYYADDIAQPVSADLSRANMRPIDASLLVGAGIDFHLYAGRVPLLLSVEGGYSFGLCNNFSTRELRDNPDIAESDRSLIANNFFGAELWRESRHTSGIELAMRLSIALNGWNDGNSDSERMRIVRIVDKSTDTIYINDTVTLREKPDTVFVPQKVIVNRTIDYIKKDCYSVSEMHSFLTLGIDISDKRICIYNINFDFDSYNLRPESEKPLKEILAMMKEYPEMIIEVYGHTDSIGTDEYNQRLSENRAAAIVKYLNSHGVSTTRVHPIGYGPKYPISTNETEEGRFQNRRVEIEVVKIGRHK